MKNFFHNLLLFRSYHFANAMMLIYYLEESEEKNFPIFNDDDEKNLILNFVSRLTTTKKNKKEIKICNFIKCMLLFSSLVD
jgi:hypothetical protein